MVFQYRVVLTIRIDKPAYIQLKLEQEKEYTPTLAGTRLSAWAIGLQE